MEANIEKLAKAMKGQPPEVIQSIVKHLLATDGERAAGAFMIAMSK